MRLEHALYERLAGRAIRVGEYRGDLRTAARLPIQRRAHLGEMGADHKIGARITVLVKEFSATGTRILLNRELAIDSHFVLWICDLSRVEVAIECRVVRCVAVASECRLYVIGAAFEQMCAPALPGTQRREPTVDEIRAAILRG